MIPKSLHTVTAIVAVAQRIGTYESFYSNTALIQLAVDVLGYNEAMDIYDLKGQALKKLNKLRTNPALSLVA
jgi:hypothetical protein